MKPYRSWIDSHFIIKVKLAHITDSTLDEYFNSFLKSYVDSLRLADPTLPPLVIENIESQTNAGINYRIYYTYPFNNHPFLIYWTKESTTIHLVISLGNRIGQINFNVVYPLIPSLTGIERRAIIMLVIKSIVVRQSNLMYHPKYSVLNCNIVAECNNKVNIIIASKLDDIKKHQMIAEINKFYLDKIKLLIDQYFIILQNKKFDDAMKFLKGEYNRFFISQGLTEIFIDSANLVGHLEIFIHLYKLLNTIHDWL